MILGSHRAGQLRWLGATLGLGLAAVLVFGAEPAAKTRAPSTNAAEGKERDLGQGLAYYRIHSLPGDLPALETGKPPACVLDLRFVPANRAGAAALRAWVSGRVAQHSPVFILANADTDGDLLALLRTHEWGGAVMTVGIPLRNFQPDVAVAATATEERAAYDAFENGATIASLLMDHPGKIRYDETNLGKDRRAEQPARPANEAAAKDASARRVDPTLQRAVHLHRALSALKKI